MKIIKVTYCGVCPYLDERIFMDTMDGDEPYDSVIYCTHFHGIGMEPIVRKLTQEEYDSIPDWCPL